MPRDGKTSIRSRGQVSSVSPAPSQASSNTLTRRDSMTRSEVAKLLSLATANFPAMQERDMRPTLVLWEKMLSDLPPEVAEAALLKVLVSAKFFPTVAEIREAAVQISQPR